MDEKEIENRLKQGITVSPKEMLYLFWRTKSREVVRVLLLNFKDSIVLK